MSADPITISSDELEPIIKWLNENHPGWRADYSDRRGTLAPVQDAVIAKLDWLNELEAAYKVIRKALEKVGY